MCWTKGEDAHRASIASVRTLMEPAVLTNRPEYTPARSGLDWMLLSLRMKCRAAHENATECRCAAP